MPYIGDIITTIITLGVFLGIWVKIKSFLDEIKKDTEWKINLANAVERLVEDTKENKSTNRDYIHFRSIVETDIAILKRDVAELKSILLQREVVK